MLHVAALLVNSLLVALLLEMHCSKILLLLLILAALVAALFLVHVAAALDAFLSYFFGGVCWFSVTF